MKGNRGVTLTSLIVYIIGMLIMLATLATLRTFFSKNVDIRAINDDTIQYSKFASAFSTETNTKDNKVIECRTQRDEKGEKRICFVEIAEQKMMTMQNFAGNAGSC